MAYQTYITEALVCGTRTSNTSDKLYLLFTKDAGMVYAHARSVREEKSKHRYSLQLFSHIRVTLVRGKSGWKITGTEPVRNFFTEASSREVRAFFRNVIKLLSRVMQGETVYPQVFDDVVDAGLHVETSDVKKLEKILSLRILHALGYVAPLSEYRLLLRGKIPYDLVDALAPETEKKCNDVVEYALVQSQL